MQVHAVSRISWLLTFNCRISKAICKQTISVQCPYSVNSSEGQCNRFIKTQNSSSYITVLTNPMWKECLNLLTALKETMKNIISKASYLLIWHESSKCFIDWPHGRCFVPLDSFPPQQSPEPTFPGCAVVPPLPCNTCNKKQSHTLRVKHYAQHHQQSLHHFHLQHTSLIKKGKSHSVALLSITNWT